MNFGTLHGVAAAIVGVSNQTDGLGQWWLPEDASTKGHHIDHLFNVVVVETGVAFAVVVALLVYFMFRYRSRPGHRAVYTHGNERRHLYLTLSLAMVVFIGVDLNIVRLANANLRDIRASSPDPAEAVEIEVLAEQFAWNVRYPGGDGEIGTMDDVVARNEMHVPLGKKIVVKLRSRDVIHSFCLPHLRIKMDCVPGMTTGVWFEAAHVGQFELACAELCGWGHYTMRGRLIVETPEQFERWLEDQRAEMERAE
jgi:cytochrome c oxidase subunit 2